MAGDGVPTTRLRRTARMTGVAAGVAARTTGTMVATRRSPEARREALSKQQIRAARSLVKLLGGMRGAAMKLGQTLSTVDLGLVPAEIRPEFQEILAELQQGAEPVRFDALRKVVEEDLGAPLARSFADVDPQPLAAASIGQVHRARLKDGREVVLKVQYPGIAEAVHADMRNLWMGLKLIDVVAPGIDSKAIADELRERVAAELDYELEAQNHRAMACVYRDHPFVVVPRPVTELCRERTLVTEFVDGRRFAEILGAPDERRDRYGEILARFYVNGPLRHRLLNGDPHPGNALFLDDGRVAFVDFGFFKRLGDVEVAQLVQSSRALYHGDAQRLFEIVVELGGLPPDPALVEPFYESYRAIFGWLIIDERRMVSDRDTGAMMRRYHRMRGTEGFGRMDLPAEHLVLMRAIMQLIGQIGQLRATNNWLDIAREWLLDEPPATPLGQAEAEFFAGRGHVTSRARA